MDDYISIRRRSTTSFYIKSNTRKINKKIWFDYIYEEQIFFSTGYPVIVLSVGLQ